MGATPHVIETLLSGFLKHFRRGHPGVDVHLTEEGGAHLANRLERRDVQLAHMPAGDERFYGRLLYPMHLLVLVPKKHRLSGHSVVDVSELEDEPLLLLGPDFGSHQWFKAACHIGRIRPRVLLESSAPHTLVALAAVGYGVAIMPSNAQIPNGKIRAMPLVHDKASIGTWSMIAWDPRRFLAPYAKQFVDELVAHVRQDYPGRDVVTRAPPLPRPKLPAG